MHPLGKHIIQNKFTDKCEFINLFFKIHQKNIDCFSKQLLVNLRHRERERKKEMGDGGGGRKTK